jgi:hypothetical protein
MKTWTAVILLMSLAAYGCNALMSPEGLAILDKQMAVLEANLSQARIDLANGDLSQEKVVAMLEAQMAGLQSQQAELAKLLTTVGQGAGLPPELAAAGGGVGASLLVGILSLFRGMTARRRETEAAAAKESRKRKELHERINELEAK